MVTTNAIYDEGSDTTYVPFIAPDGRVGYRCIRGDDTTYVYLNPSVNTPDDPADANVFVYDGAKNDPAYDSADVHVLVWNAWDGDAHPDPVVEALAVELDELKWPSVAADVRDGVDTQTVLDRLHDIGEGDSDAADALAAHISRTEREDADRSAEPDLSHWAVADAAAHLARLADAGCTGAVTPLQDGSVVIQHDGESCPIHEPHTPHL